MQSAGANNLCAVRVYEARVRANPRDHVVVCKIVTVSRGSLKRGPWERHDDGTRLSRDDLPAAAPPRFFAD